MSACRVGQRRGTLLLDSSGEERGIRSLAALMYSGSLSLSVGNFPRPVALELYQNEEFQTV